MKSLMVVSAIILGITYLAYAPKWWRSPLAIFIVLYVLGVVLLQHFYIEVAILFFCIVNISLALFVSRIQERSYREYRKHPKE